MKIINSAIAAMEKLYLCDNCLGRIYSNLLSGFTNQERGQTIRKIVAFLVDSGEELKILKENFYGIKFRNVKMQVEKPKECMICKNFFETRICELAKKAAEKLDGIDFKTFLVGCVPADEMVKKEEELWSIAGIEFVEPIKSEINREIGKLIENITGKTFNLQNPEITIIFDLKNESIKLQIKSLFILGRYKKLKRGIPQSKWTCSICKGKGCRKCKGLGKLYSTSVQEIIEKPLLKATGSKSSSFSGSGREDIDARCLDWRPFVLELKKPIKRNINLKKIEKQINKSKSVKVNQLKFAEKHDSRSIKSERLDKTYAAEVTFEKKIEKNLLKQLKQLVGQHILQKTPRRVLHRRADKIRKRTVKFISWNLLGPNKILFKIRAEAGLYIKELITGDDGRTSPNISEFLNNKVKKIKLDVIKIHTK